MRQEAWGLELSCVPTYSPPPPAVETRWTLGDPVPGPVLALPLRPLQGMPLQTPLSDPLLILKALVDKAHHTHIPYSWLFKNSPSPPGTWGGGHGERGPA